MPKPTHPTTSFFKHRGVVQAGIALSAAALLVTALSTFAAAPSAVSWQAQGKDYRTCSPSGRGGVCTPVPENGTVYSYYNYTATYRTAALAPGTYELKLTYANFGTPPPNYAYQVQLQVGKEKRNLTLPAGPGPQETTVRGLPLKAGATNVRVTWTNDSFQAGQYDANFAISQLSLQRTATASAKPKPLGVNQRRQQAAKQLLDTRRVSFLRWGGNLSEPRTSVAESAKSKCSPAPAVRKCLKVDPRIYEAVLEISEKFPVQINSVTDRQHSGNSEHYKGTAIDLGKDDQHAREIVAIARKHGATRWAGSVPNPSFADSPTHIHLDWQGSR